MTERRNGTPPPFSARRRTKMGGGLRLDRPLEAEHRAPIEILGSLYAHRPFRAPIRHNGLFNAVDAGSVGLEINV